MPNKKRWLYGDSWEKFPIEPGEIWRDRNTNSMVSVHDIRRPIPYFFNNIDMVYCDPPWSRGNFNCFITKAGLDSYINDFENFISVLFLRIAQINPRCCYLEIGRQHFNDFKRKMSQLYPCIQSWEITYYKKNPCFLIRGGFKATLTDFTGLDDEITPFKAISTESPGNIGDLCTGRGLTLLAAIENGIPFFGTELNKRRLAVAIERANKKGAFFEKYLF